MKIRNFALGLSLLFSAGLAAGEEAQEGLKVGDDVKQIAFEHVFGKNAPEDAAKVNLSELRGRVVILEYWATW